MEKNLKYLQILEKVYPPVMLKPETKHDQMSMLIPSVKFIWIFVAKVPCKAHLLGCVRHM